MSKAVMISIQPKWCELIASGKKTIEIRKTAPKIPAPFKCYIYCTKGKDLLRLIDVYGTLKGKHFHKKTCRINNLDYNTNKIINGKVIGEYIVDKIDTIPFEVINDAYNGMFNDWNDYDLDKACLHPDDLDKYANFHTVYALHIFDLKIYDKPKELGEFRYYVYGCENPKTDCSYCKYSVRHYPTGVLDCDNKVTSPPQSYFYVEEEIEEWTE